jgi:ring-1,2-phenylacetyl-CoA epoxidase subunit PaaB
MPDTQLPRFQVFLQEREGAPHQDVGSVHAPDAELALQNGRDVFVRRPECASLWVVPVEAIFSRTAQELEVESSRTNGEQIIAGEQSIAGEEIIAAQVGSSQGKRRKNSEEAYYVFHKTRQIGTQTLAGQVQASSPEAALQQAIGQYSGRQPALVWWVFPARCVTASQPLEADSFFSPALDKPFRMATDFHTLTAMRAIKSSPAIKSSRDPGQAETGAAAEGEARGT